MLGQSSKIFLTLGFVAILLFIAFQSSSFSDNGREVFSSMHPLQKLLIESQRYGVVASDSKSRAALITNLQETIKFTLDNWNNPDIKAGSFKSVKREKFGTDSEKKTGIIPEARKGQQKDETEMQHPELKFCPFKWVDCYTSYVPTNCSLKVTKVEDVVTIILNFMRYPDQITAGHVLKGLASVHPNIPVLAAWPDNGNTPKVDMEHVKFLTFAKSTQASKVWSSLMKSVKTTYVLVARDVNFMDSDIELERMLRVMSTLPEDAIIGGATRTPNGHWRMSCDQMSLRNYTLAFKSGYKKSTLEGCLYCDYPIGPFLAKASNIDFSATQLADDAAVFINFFVKKRKSGVGVYVCPDAMFHVNPQENINTTDYWLATAKQLKVEIIVINEEKIRLPCSKVGLRCSPWHSKGIALPPCCMKRLSDEIAFLLEACALHNIYCDLRSGNLIGAVKFGSTLPWEIDGDFYVLKDNHTAFKNLKPYFVKRGWKVSGNNPVDFVKKGSGFRTEVYKVGDSVLQSTYYTSKGMKPTRVNLDGNWVVTPRNPGRQTMREYEMTVYKHAEHNTFHGKTPMARYSERKFLKCPKPGFHACLDLYKSDGNMQFNQDFFDTFN